MGVRDAMRRSRSFGEPLGESDARVAQAETVDDAPRAWFGTDSHDRLQPFAVSQVIEVTPVAATIGSPPDAVLVAKVICHEPRLNDVFLAFMDDVLSQLGPQGSVDVLVRSASEWRNLLRVAQQGMGDSWKNWSRITARISSPRGNAMGTMCTTSSAMSFESRSRRRPSRISTR